MVLMMEGNMRGQAALEYIISYGWIFIVLLAVIAALAFFGVIDVAKYMPSHCDMESGFVCSDYRLGSDALTILLVNTFDVDLLNVSVSLSSFDGSCNETLLVGDFRRDTQEYLEFCAGNDFPSRLNGVIEATYTFRGERVTHTNKGRFALWQEG